MSWRAHPRSRGENDDIDRAQANKSGSSPLTRGKLLRRDHRRDVHGLIPAHAGKTSLSASATILPWAHPRSHGENPGGVPVYSTWEGSSPLTRGKLDALGVAVRAGGLIPAHAGKTRSRPCSGTRSRAHPRSRGENVKTTLVAGPTGGSSPLTRGKQASVRLPDTHTGSSPLTRGKPRANPAAG